MQEEKGKNRVKSWCAAFIPRYCKPGLILWVFEVLRFFQKAFSKKRNDLGIEENNVAFLNHKERLLQNDGYIEDQVSYTDMNYGKTKVQGTGCEVIATYNALRSLGCEMQWDFPKLIQAFEADGMVLFGKAGSTPKAILDFFLREGFRAGLIVKEALAGQLAREYDSLILTMYNDKKDIMEQIHTVHISKKEGAYFVHNASASGRVLGPYDTIEQLLSSLNGGRAQMISMIGISKMDPEEIEK